MQLSPKPTSLLLFPRTEGRTATSRYRIRWGRVIKMGCNGSPIRSAVLTGFLEAMSSLAIEMRCIGQTKMTRASSVDCPDLSGRDQWLALRCGYAGHDFSILSSRRTACYDLNDTGGQTHQCANLPGRVIGAGKVEDQSAAPGANR